MRTIRVPPDVLPDKPKSDLPRPVPGGRVFLVGAGPGDPGLLTVKGRARLRQADVVVYDRLANPALLTDLADHVVRIDVGKRHGRSSPSQEAINQTLLEHARAGRTVARLKGGDPFIFGRGGEEALALAAAGIPFEVVPGVSAASAAAAYAGIPITHRGLNAAVTFVTGQRDADPAAEQARWRKLGASDHVLVFFMGVRNLRDIAAALVAGGRDPNTPAAAIHWGTRPNQRTVTAPLADLPTAAVALTSPTLVVVGDVVNLRPSLNWFETRPLFGRRVVVTRSARGLAGVDGAGQVLVDALEEAGAEVLPVPAIQVLPMADPEPLNAAVAALGSGGWLVLTSANGVAALFDALHRTGRDSRALAPVRVAVVGEKTGAALARHGIRADLVAGTARAEGLSTALLDAIGDPRGVPVRLVQAEAARPLLRERLAAAGAKVAAVAAYRTVAAGSDESPAQSTQNPVRTAIDSLAAGPVPDYVTFTSGAAVTHLRATLGAAPFARVVGGARIAVIGPVTARACEDAGLNVAVTALAPDMAALAAAVVADAATHELSR